jgi:CHAT domain-containing protein/Tfp pilus assembly protein PilF
MKILLPILLFLACLSLQAQTPPADPPKSWSPEPLEDSVTKYIKKGDYARALSFAGQWLEKARKNPGKDSLDYAAAIYFKGDALRRSGDYEQASPPLTKSLEIRKKALGPEHPDVARSLNSLGNLYSDMGEYTKAEAYYLQALAILKKALGPEHPNVATSLNNLGILYSDIGEYTKAEPYYQQALETFKKALGLEHPDVARPLNSLGVLYSDLGEYAKAEPFYLQALEIWRKALGPEHPKVAASLNNLGILYQEMGEYTKAEPYQLQALEIRKKALGTEHPDVAISLNNLGILYDYMGEYTKAEPYYLQALEIWRKALGTEHPDVAISLNNLGILYYELGKYAKAEPYHLQALEIWRKALGTEHPDVAPSLNNLGILYKEMGEYAKAEPYYLQALEIQKKSLGPEHPLVAASLNGLGTLYCDMGEYEKAEAYHLQALEIRRKALGPEHPDVAVSLHNLGVLFRSQKNPNKAKQELNQLGALNNISIKRYFPAMSEQGREDYLKKGLEERESLLSFWGEEGVKMPELRGELWNHQLFYKGLLLNTSNRWKQRIKTSGDKKLQQRFFEWENLQIKISKLFTSTDSSERAGLDSLVDKAEKLEKELSQRSENFGRSEERKARTWQEVQKALKPGEAAIEMVRFRHFGIAKTVTDTSNPKKPTYRVKGLTDTVRYAALILTKNSLQPELVILPNGNNMEENWYNYYRNFIRLKQKDSESYRRFWQPIGKKLKGIKKIWFSADGVYHKLNLGTLKNPGTGKYLMEEMDIAQLGSTKDLLKKYPDQSENRLACLVGNPEFQPGQLAVAGKSRSGPDLSYYFKPDPTLEVAALPGTQTEVDSVARLLGRKGWEVQEYSGLEASEDKIKDSYKPRVMLLSTHGFFRSDTTPGSNPLLRSGLLLAGATKTLREGHKGEGEDGILTAYEAMNLNLDNTELVVLSACETGLGEIKNGEGVYGLQRAFQVAGARNLIMSLWKVNDEVTRELIVAFFKNWTNGMKKRAAFLKAQKEIQKKYPDPYYWGAFVMVGE